MAIADQCDAAEGCGDLSEGNFEAYEEDKRRRLGDAADRSTRLAYKKLTG